MAERQTENLNDPRYHTRNTLQRLKEEIEHLRAAIDKVDEPQFEVTAETAIEVLTGLVKAFQVCEKKIGSSGFTVGEFPRVTT